MGVNNLPFESLHNIILMIVGKESVSRNEKYFFVIGKWYFKWYNSDLNEFSLKVPGYKKELISQMLDYLYWLDVLLKILKIKPSTNLEGCSLFDIMKFKSLNKYQRRGNEFKIVYLRSKHKTHYFENSTVVSIDRFLPLFPSDQIAHSKDELNEFFKLVNVIAHSNLIPYPILLDLSKNITLLITQSQINSDEKILSRSFVVDDLSEDRDEVLTALEEVDVVNCLILTYPYHVNIGSVIINEFRDRSRIFSLDIANRFSYQEIDNEQVVLTNSEIGIGSISDITDLANNFNVVDTKCDARLITVLNEIKSEWRKRDFNKFTSPLPFKWFMYIHSGFKVEYWGERFRADFPLISGLLLEKCLEALGLIYELDWIGNHLLADKEKVLVLPTSLMLDEIVTSLKAYLGNTFFHISRSNNVSDFLGNRDITVLDGFNIILLNNIFNSSNEGKVSVTLPDFIYYTYQPFACYLALQYHFLALTSGARNKLDDSYEHYSQQWKQLAELHLGKSREALKKFLSKKALGNESDIDQEAFELSELVEDFSDSEIIQVFSQKELKSYSRLSTKSIEIVTATSRKFYLFPSSQVLIKYQGRLVSARTEDLRVGLSFYPIADIVKNLDIKTMVDSLVTLSEKVKDWHQDLYVHYKKDSSLFERMVIEGISVSKATFKKEYARIERTSGDFHLPRSKNDWNIVCTFLAIADRQTAWNAIRCRQDINRLKSAYTKIIEMMVKTGNFGINVDAIFLANVTKVLAEISEINEKDDQITTDALRLIVEISNKVNLELITHIILETERT